MTPGKDILGVRDYYSGKTILMTGGTGYIGKIIIEKMIRSIPNIKRIYVMVRSKKDMTGQERIQKEIYDTLIFKECFIKYPNLRKTLDDKIVPVNGDLDKQNLGLDNDMAQRLILEVTTVISCAASIFFNDPLLQLIKTNYQGPLMLLNFAKTFKQEGVVFCHVSTAFVHSYLPGGSFVPEEILQEGDPDEIIT